MGKKNYLLLFCCAYMTTKIFIYIRSRIRQLLLRNCIQHQVYYKLLECYLKWLCCLVGLLIVSFVLSLAFLFIYFAIGYIPRWSGSCLWFGLNLSTTSVIIILPFISPHVYNLMKNHFYHRRHPTSVGPHPDRIR